MVLTLCACYSFHVQVLLAVLIFFLVTLFFFIRAATKRSGSEKTISYEKKSTADTVFVDPGFDTGDVQVNQKKGLVDEVDRMLRAADGRGAMILNNCRLRWGNGAYATVDNILICSSGIYVIKCMDLSGWIIGNGNDVNWAEFFPGRNEQVTGGRKFRNPLILNTNHVKCVRQKIQPKKFPVHNIVVFPDRCTLKKIENVGDAHVVRSGGLLETIREIHLKFKDSVSDYDMKLVYSILSNNMDMTPEREREYLETIYKARGHIEQEKNPTATRCPLCGGPLVVRYGENGKYQACMYYPKCSYTKDI